LAENAADLVFTSGRFRVEGRPLFSLLDAS